MANLNHVVQAGRLCADPELRQLQYGPICSLRLAVSTKHRNGNEETLFVDVDVKNKSAEACAQYLRKGSGALVIGRLKLDEWQTTDGQRRSKIKIIAEKVEFLDRAQGQNGNYGNGNYQQAPQQPMNYPPPNDEYPPPSVFGPGNTAPAAAQQKSLPDPSQHGWQHQKVGFQKTGNLSWSDLAVDKTLPDGTGGRQYLHKLANWKDRKDVAEIAQMALQLTAPAPAVSQPIAPPPNLDEPPF